MTDPREAMLGRLERWAGRSAPSTALHKAALDVAVSAFKIAWRPSNASRALAIEIAIRAYLSALPEQTGERWRKLADALPDVGQPVLLARWDKDGFWRVRAAAMHARHEGVCPHISDMSNGELPTLWWFEWFDCIYPGRGDMRLATSDTLWAPMPLPAHPAGESP